MVWVRVVCALAGQWGGVVCGVVGMAGVLQEHEVMKERLGTGDSRAGSLIVCDARGSTVRKIKVKRDPGCALCGDAPSITDLSIHES